MFLPFYCVRVKTSHANVLIYTVQASQPRVSHGFIVAITSYFLSRSFLLKENKKPCLIKLSYQERKTKHQILKIIAVFSV